MIKTIIFCCGAVFFVLLGLTYLAIAVIGMIKVWACWYSDIKNWLGYE